MLPDPNPAQDCGGFSQKGVSASELATRAGGSPGEGQLGMEWAERDRASAQGHKVRKGWERTWLTREGLASSQVSEGRTKAGYSGIGDPRPGAWDWTLWGTRMHREGL